MYGKRISAPEHLAQFISLSTLVAVANFAVAQEPAARAGAEVEEIVVTARHREERLLDVPDSVRAISSEVIQDAGIDNIEDAFHLVSNAVVFDDQQPGVQTVTLRGISQARGADSEPAFAFVVDGVTAPTIFSFTQDLYDIERIEVLKGPQGALYGRNAIGGAINVITKQPSNDFELGARASFAEGNEVRASARASGPIVDDKVLFRVAGSYSDYDGQLRNVTLGVRPDFLEESSLRGQVEILPTESLSVSLRASYTESEGGGAYNGTTTAGAFGATPGLIQEDALGEGSRELLDLSAKLEWETAIGQLTSVTAYTDLDTHLYQDLDFTGISVAEADQYVRLHSWMQELRFSSPDDQRIRWYGGAFLQQTSRDIQTLVHINSNGPIGTAVGGVAGDGDPASKNMVTSADRTPQWDFDSFAAFGSADFDLTDTLTLTAGFRWDREESEFFQAGAAVSTGERTFEEFQPKVSLSYHTTENTMVYGTYATGFRPGGFNPFIGYTADGTYVPETTTNYEIGFKSSWFNRSLVLNLAGFLIESEDTHQRLLNVLLGQAEYFNFGDSEYRGYEIELFATPVPGLDLQAAYGRTDSEVKSINPAITDIGGVDPTTFIGNQVPRVNDSTFSLAVQYTYPLLDSMDLVARADYQRLGTGYWYLDNVDVQRPYETANFRVGLKGDTWSVTGYVENAFDEEWHVTFNNTQFEGLLGGINIFWPSPRRQAGIQVAYDFF